jgi:hypothetical protein
VLALVAARTTSEGKPSGPDHGCDRVHGGIGHFDAMGISSEHDGEARRKERRGAAPHRRWRSRSGAGRRALGLRLVSREVPSLTDCSGDGPRRCPRRGDDPLKIKQRAGHSTFSTTELYIRQAEAVREGFGEVFPPLPPSALDFGILSDLSQTPATLEPKTRGKQWRRRESKRPKKARDRPRNWLSSRSTRYRNRPDSRPFVTSPKLPRPLAGGTDGRGARERNPRRGEAGRHWTWPAP